MKKKKNPLLSFLKRHMADHYFFDTHKCVGAQAAS